VPTLTLPDPSLVVMVGAAGSGKSTLAARLFAPAEILSSDAFRAAIAGDERDQRATGAAFRAIERTLERRLGAGLLTVVDATNVRAGDRRPWVLAANRHGIALVALVLDLPWPTVLAQNAGRGRVVETGVVERHLALLRRTVDRDELRAEGFDVVVILRSTDDVRALTGIDRQPTHPSESTVDRVAKDER